AGSMHKPGLRVLRVKWTPVDVASAGSPYYQRGGGSPAVVRLGHHIHDLVEGTADEVHELELGDRPHSGEGGAERSSHDCRLRNRRINHASRSEVIDEAVSNLESSAVNADVFAQAEHTRVALHLFPDSRSEERRVGKECRARCWP